MINAAHFSRQPEGPPAFCPVRSVEEPASLASEGAGASAASAKALNCDAKVTEASKFFQS